MFASRFVLFAASCLSFGLLAAPQAEASCYSSCSSRAAYYSPYSNGLRPTYGHAGTYSHSYRYAPQPSYYSQPVAYYAQPVPYYSQPTLRRRVSYNQETSYVPVSRMKTVTVLKAKTRIVPVRTYKAVTTYHPVRVRKVVTRYQPVTSWRRSVSYSY